MTTDMAVPTLRERAAAVLAEPRLTARVLFSVIAVFGVLGILQRNLPYFPLSHTMDLDFEWMPPALWSALLDASAAAAFGILVRRGLAPRAGAFLAGMFGLMSLDEWFGLHERLERAFGVPWLKLYSPVIAAAGIGTLLLLRAWGTRYLAASKLLMGGGLLWFFAQVLEEIQWTGPDRSIQVAHYAWYMIPEELMEMSGSALFLLSGLVVLKAARTSREHSQVL